MGKLAFWMILVLTAWGPSDAWAMRCQGRVVSLGDTRYQVLAKCGPPSYVEERYEDRLGIAGGRLYMYDPMEKRYSGPWVVEQVIIEEWTYNFGPHSLMYYLRFENGVLDRIRTGDYGF
jgi:hypothetical protein